MVSANPSDEEPGFAEVLRNAKAFETVNLAGPRGVPHIKLVPTP
jgi:hypothetical protein